MINIILTFIVALLWGITPVLFRIVLHNVPNTFVMLISGIVYLIGTLSYIIIYDYKNIKFDIIKKYIPHISIISFFGFFLAYMLYYYVLKHTDNVNIMIAIISISPIITLLTTYFIKQEEFQALTYRQVFGIFMIVLGVILALFE